MSELDVLTTMLKSEIRYDTITTDGNCFFHALEYALGNCRIDDTRSPLFNQTRQHVSQLLLGKYLEDLREVQQRMQRLRSPALLKDRIRIQRKIAFMHHFMNSLEYSTEEVIYFSALLKDKILFIVRDQMYDGEFQVTLIVPDGVTFTRDNILVLIHSNGNHYNTLTYPLTRSDKFLNMLQKYHTSEDDQRSTDVDGVHIKFGILKHVLKYYDGLAELRKETQIRTNHAMAQRLAEELDENAEETNLKAAKELALQFEEEARNFVSKKLTRPKSHFTRKNASRMKTNNAKPKSATKKGKPPKRMRASRRNSSNRIRGQSLNRAPNVSL